MIGAQWNVRSLHKEGRLQCVCDFISDNKLDFVSFQETKMNCFTDSFLRSINKEFNWNYLPANGTAGGILVGFHDKKFEIIAWQIGSFTVSTMVRNICDGFTWRLISVYGSPYDEGKAEFTEELGNLLDNWGALL